MINTLSETVGWFLVGIGLKSNYLDFHVIIGIRGALRRIDAAEILNEILNLNY